MPKVLEFKCAHCPEDTVSFFECETFEGDDTELRIDMSCGDDEDVQEALEGFCIFLDRASEIALLKLLLSRATNQD